MQKKTINWLAILRGWAVLLVIIFHSRFEALDGTFFGSFLDYANGFFRFRMPLFFFISGFLLYYTKLKKNSSYREILTERVPRIVYPYFFITLILFFLKFILSASVKRVVDFSLWGFVKCFLFPENLPWEPYWFLNVILIYFLCYPLVKRSLKNGYTALATLVGALLFYLFFPKNIALFDLSKVIQMFFFFYGGILFAKYNCIRYMRDRSVIVLCVFCFLLFAAWGISPLFHAISGIVASVCLSLLAARYIPNLFSSFRNYYYQIYLLGTFAQAAIFSWYGLIESPFLLFLFVVAGIFGGIYIPVGVTMLVKQIKWKPLHKLIGL